MTGKLQESSVLMMFQFGSSYLLFINYAHHILASDSFGQQEKNEKNFPNLDRLLWNTQSGVSKMNWPGILLHKYKYPITGYLIGTKFYAVRLPNGVS